MSNFKKDVLQEEEVVINLDESVMETFTLALESAINKTLEEFDRDVKLELLVTLGLFSAQVSLDNHYDKDSFIQLMSELFDDVEESVEAGSDDEEEALESTERYSLN